ncbi:hypothetical protein HEP_00340400 [Hepatocystis sp. ex Piliocolobus tephrosceles]|nr:hypothetical protein HEP_00340400 [Hepatocystis sp. ex Piliocolobus tephrosceles]
MEACKYKQYLSITKIYLYMNKIKSAFSLLFNKEHIYSNTKTLKHFIPFTFYLFFMIICFILPLEYNSYFEICVKNELKNNWYKRLININNNNNYKVKRCLRNEVNLHLSSGYENIDGEIVLLRENEYFDIIADVLKNAEDAVSAIDDDDEPIENAGAVLKRSDINIDYLKELLGENYFKMIDESANMFNSHTLFVLLENIFYKNKINLIDLEDELFNECTNLAEAHNVLLYDKLLEWAIVCKYITCEIIMHEHMQVKNILQFCKKKSLNKMDIFLFAYFQIILLQHFKKKICHKWKKYLKHKFRNHNLTRSNNDE